MAERGTAMYRSTELGGGRQEGRSLLIKVINEAFAHQGHLQGRLDHHHDQQLDNQDCKSLLARRDVQIRSSGVSPVCFRHKDKM